MPNIRINDFAKFGVWPDGYYMSTEEFIGSDFSGSGMFAFDRSKMLVGDRTAAYIYFNRPSSTTARLGNVLPADLDGLRPPPTGAPNIFVGYSATEYGDTQDAVRLFDFHADFANPVNSTFTERSESPLPVAAFDPTSPEGRFDITQPAPGERLDANSDRINYRVAYRNFGASDSLIFNQTAAWQAIHTAPVFAFTNCGEAEQLSQLPSNRPSATRIRRVGSQALPPIIRATSPSVTTRFRIKRNRRYFTQANSLANRRARFARQKL